MLGRKLCVVGFMLFNEINAVAKLSRGINNFFAGSEIKISNSFGIKDQNLGLKTEISYEKICLVTTLKWFLYLREA